MNYLISILFAAAALCECTLAFSFPHQARKYTSLNFRKGRATCLNTSSEGGPPTPSDDDDIPDIKAFQERVDMFDGNITASNNGISKLGAEMEKHEETEKLVEEIKKLAEEIKKQHHEISAMHEELAGNGEAMEVNLEAIEVNLEAIEVDLDAIEVDLDALQARVDAIEVDLDALKARVDDLKDWRDLISDRPWELHWKLHEKFYLRIKERHSCGI
jgi:peptidoglycan hydrolase CwlO-like protein